MKLKKILRQFFASLFLLSITALFLDWANLLQVGNIKLLRIGVVSLVLALLFSDLFKIKDFFQTIKKADFSSIFEKKEIAFKNFFEKKWVKWGLIPVFFLLLGLGLTITSVFISDEAFSVLVKNHSRQESNLFSGKELLPGQQVQGEFKSVENNLGIVAIRFDTSERRDNETITFRLKEKGTGNWYYENIYTTEQFQSDEFFPFGFPKIENSKNKTYVFELEPQEDTEGFLQISSSKPIFESKYQLSKTQITQNIPLLANYLYTKLSFSFQNNKICFVFLLIFLPFSYLISKIYFKFYSKERTVSFFNFFLQIIFLTSLLFLFFSNFLIQKNINLFEQGDVFFNFLTALTGLLLILKSKEKIIATKIKKPKGAFLILIFILFLGFFLRTWNLGFLYPAGDEYRHLNAAKHFLAEGYFEYPRSPLITYVVIAVRKIFNTNSLFLQRLPFAIIGSISVFLFFLIGKKQNFWIGIIAAYLFAVCPLSVGLSRYIREYEIILFISLLFIYFSRLKILKNKLLQLLILIPLFAITQKIGLSSGYRGAFFLFAMFISTYSAGEIINKICPFPKRNKLLKFCLFIIIFVIGIWLIPHFTEYQQLSTPKFEYLYFVNYKHSNVLWYSKYAPYILICLLSIAPILIHPQSSFIWATFFTVIFTSYFYINYFNAPRRFQVRYIYYLLPYFTILASSGIYYYLELFKKIKHKIASILFIIILIFSFSSYKIINFTFNDKNGELDSRTKLPHFNAGALKKFLDQEKINSKKILTTYPYFFDYYYNNPYLKTNLEKKKYIHFPWSYEYYDRTKIFSINGYWGEENIAKIKDLIKNNDIEFLVLHVSCKDKRPSKQYDFLLTKIDSIESYATIDLSKAFGFYIYKVTK